MGELNFYSYKTTIGQIFLLASDKGLRSLSLNGDEFKPYTYKPNILTNTAANQLMEYLSGKRRYFDIEFDLDCSDFEAKVYAAILNIPYAQTSTCRDIAIATGAPSNAQSIGRAVSKNPCPIFIPTHRIIRNVNISTKSAFSIDKSNKLLEFEKLQIKSFS